MLRDIASDCYGEFIVTARAVLGILVLTARQWDTAVLVLLSVKDFFFRGSQTTHGLVVKPGVPSMHDDHITGGHSTSQDHLEQVGKVSFGQAEEKMTSRADR